MASHIQHFEPCGHEDELAKLREAEAELIEVREKLRDAVEELRRKAEIIERGDDRMQAFLAALRKIANHGASLDSDILTVQGIARAALDEAQLIEEKE